MGLDRTHRLFERASLLPPDERAAWLEEHCDSSTERTEVAELLAAAEAADADGAEMEWASSMRDLRVSAFDDAQRTLKAGMTLGDFTLTRRLGAGGMGEVWEATQSRPQRAAAVKVMRPGWHSSRMFRRFEIEAESLGRLNHPGIAAVYGAGVDDFGSGAVPWFAMELISGGRPITDFARDEELDTAECCRLIADVCEAVHHGHIKGIVHRDLKPTNVLVDARGTPRVIDFGVARCTDSDVAMTTVQTAAGEVVGTVQYMSPEQLGTSDTDARSDVYSLGVLLYEVLTGSPPYDVTGTHLTEAARIVSETPPPRLAIKAARGRNLDAVVRVAMAKDPARRYESAAALAADLRRVADGRNVLARPPGRMESLVLTIRRHPAITALTATLLLTIAIGWASTSIQATNAKLAGVRQNHRIASIELRGHDLAAAEAALGAVPPEFREWPWQLLAGQVAAPRSAISTAAPGHGNAYAIADPLGDHAPLIFSDTFKLCPPGQGEDAVHIEVPARGTPWQAAWLADGNLVVSTLEGRLGMVAPDHRWVDLTENVAGVANAGERVIVAYRDGHVDAFSARAPDLTPITNVGREDIRALKATPAGDMLICTGTDNSSYPGDVLHYRDGDLLTLPRVHEGRVEDVALNTNGTWGVSVGMDGRIVRWDLVNRTPTATVRPHDGAVHGTAISGCERWIATAGDDRTVRVLDATTMEELYVFTGHQFIVWDVTFDSNGWIASTGERMQSSLVPYPPPTTKVPRTAADMPVPDLPDWAGTGAAVAAPDRRRIALGEKDPLPGVRHAKNPRLAVVDAETHAITASVEYDGPFADSIAWHPSGAWLAAGGRNDRLIRWRPDTGELDLFLDDLGWVDALAFDPAGTRLAIAAQNKTILVYDLARDEVSATLTGNLATIPQLRWTDDGRWLIGGASDGRVQVWDPRAEALLVDLRPVRSKITYLDVDEETGDLLVGDGDKRLHRLTTADQM